MTIVEFLNARLDEQERLAREALGYETSDHDGPFLRHAVDYLGPELADHIAAHDPATVLARVAAWRAVIHQHGIGDGAHECPDGFMDSAETEPHTGWELVCMTQRHLASVYAEHPDYQQEWKP